MHPAKPLVFLSLAAAAVFAGERLCVPPLDTATMRLDAGFATLAAALYRDTEDSTGASLSALVAGAFHPRFAAAVSRAARGVQGAPAGDTSARYALRVDTLEISLRRRAFGRRYVPPSQPEFDPATGELSAGDRSGRMEGPGWMTTLTAAARWSLWDRLGDSAVARGASAGASSFRGEPQRGDVDRAARELAKAVLRATPFSP